LFGEFAKAVGQAHEILLLPVFAAREENASGVSSRELAVKTLETNTNARYVDSLEAAEVAIRKSADDESVVMIVGAGNVTLLAASLTK
jgi:UDP-N-acetylmuramate-alanine ligase